MATYKQLDQISTEHNLQKFILHKDTIIHVMVSLDNIVKMKFDQNKLIKF